MIRKSIGALCAAMLAASSSQAAEKPKELVIGITTFLSGPASVFGVPGKNAADMMIADLNAKGGILGVPVRSIVIDEGAGANQLMSEYRRVVLNEKAEVMFASVSSANCLALAPVAEDLEVPNILWDCSSPRIFEDNKYKFNVRTQAHTGAEMLAAALYLVKNKPNFKTVAGVNQDYAAGRDQWALFLTALKALKPDVQVVAELFPKFGAPDYSTEISRIQALKPDVIVNTSWGGDLDTFVQQAAARGAMTQGTYVFPLGESSLERLGNALPAGVVIGARGDHYFDHPKHKSDAAFQDFVKRYREKTGSYPIYPVFHMSQAMSAMQKAYEKAAVDNKVPWPSKEQLLAAFKNLSFHGLTSEVSIRDDSQGLEDQLIGTTVRNPAFNFATLDNIAIYPGKLVTTPIGQKSAEWLTKIKSDLANDPSIELFSAKQ
ncbi:branched-chain amino acid ABC transporter substrate-binding protein [Bosea sp. Tri-44]|uniref:ABC transporter substrate-binding protein n=1 Tax=Bosea sp. Tri-44 TaxID=1972137 RepID=UPI00100EE2D0|nr:ABC transporter substrate-binding protein [Bosea sp. Tri-44]RXT51236.1 branched-chain amino acid ABC transporter substrate-binding protein [Bosea sp. Tri-44]